MRKRPDRNDLRAAWERNSGEWIRWAREEGLDAHYASYHRDLFLDLAPAVAGRTLELGAAAASLPFPDASFELVLAFMSLQDMDDLDGAVAEAARVLAPGGSFCLAVVHPLDSAGEFVGGDAASPFVIEGSYLGDSFFTDLLERDGGVLRLESAHRPIERYAGHSPTPAAS